MVGGAYLYIYVGVLWVIEQVNRHVDDPSLREVYTSPHFVVLCNGRWLSVT